MQFKLCAQFCAKFWIFKSGLFSGKSKVWLAGSLCRGYYSVLVVYFHIQNLRISDAFFQKWNSCVFSVYFHYQILDYCLSGFFPFSFCTILSFQIQFSIGFSFPYKLLSFCIFLFCLFFQGRRPLCESLRSVSKIPKSFKMSTYHHTL